MSLENGLPRPGSAVLLAFLKQIMQDSSVSTWMGKAAVDFIKHQAIMKI